MAEYDKLLGEVEQLKKDAEEQLRLVTEVEQKLEEDFKNGGYIIQSAIHLENVLDVYLGQHFVTYNRGAQFAELILNELSFGRKIRLFGDLCDRYENLGHSVTVEKMKELLGIRNSIAHRSVYFDHETKKVKRVPNTWKYNTKTLVEVNENLVRDVTELTRVAIAGINKVMARIRIKEGENKLEIYDTLDPRVSKPHP